MKHNFKKNCLKLHFYFHYTSDITHLIIQFKIILKQIVVLYPYIPH